MTISAEKAEVKARSAAESPYFTPTDMGVRFNVEFREEMGQRLCEGHEFSVRLENNQLSFVSPPGLLPWPIQVVVLRNYIHAGGLCFSKKRQQSIHLTKSNSYQLSLFGDSDPGPLLPRYTIFAVVSIYRNEMMRLTMFLPTGFQNNKVFGDSHVVRDWKIGSLTGAISNEDGDSASIQTNIFNPVEMESDISVTVVEKDIDEPVSSPLAGKGSSVSSTQSTSKVLQFPPPAEDQTSAKVGE
jgi:hypothetical protein